MSLCPKKARILSILYISAPVLNGLEPSTKKIGSKKNQTNNKYNGLPWFAMVCQSKPSQNHEF